MIVITEKTVMNRKKARQIKRIFVKPTKNLKETKGTLQIIFTENKQKWETILIEGETLYETKYQSVLKTCKKILAQDRELKAWEGLEIDEI